MGCMVKESMSLYCDNEANINISHDPIQYDCTKHIEVDRHFIKELLQDGLICTPYVRTGDCHSSYSSSMSNNSVPFSVIHSNVWRLALIASLFGFHYFVIFIGEYTSVTWIYLLKSKNKVFSIF